ncbi:phosphinothricin acetyltransferase [Bradyrhizobium sp. CIR48]|uniref:GNAT family N-acetyltransferase n=1 Tax=Bradyrhizobium sp. CIR48 TaxID=2663840 RepID=UPI001605A7FD|nr:GNAT family N-acetyltransferase [Bradyrhizobium sp. CIR48]MBB4423801.1 phosphinothricin acetyltransferase [Bradyrhizobium sp. CIR48]
MIRRAKCSDVEDITAIYNQAIAPGVFATSQVSPDTPSERLAWLEQHQGPYAAFVYQDDSRKTIAWCSLNAFSVRPEYIELPEVSFYVDEKHRRRGIGKLMLAHLIDTANTFGLRGLFGRTFERNVGAIKNFNLFGFRRVATLRELSRIRGEWHNDVWLWKQLR